MTLFQDVAGRRGTSSGVRLFCAYPTSDGNGTPPHAASPERGFDFFHHFATAKENISYDYRR